MGDEAYQKLAKVLDTLPNGFPATESGIEIKLLKKIFKPEQAELFCDLKLTFETPEQISKRTGRPLKDLEEMLTAMWQRGQIFGIEFGGSKLFKMVPWAFGIFEFQLPHMDRELAEMCEEYSEVYGKQFFEKQPQLMQVIPIEREIPAKHESLTYEKVSSIIETGQSFLLNQCICKKEKGLLDNPCEKPLEVCLAIAPVPGIFKDSKVGHTISKEEAYEVLQKSEEEGLVHLTWNVESGHYFICNCCGCCCGVLEGINRLGIPASKVLNSYYYAEIDPDECTLCGVCADERCQVNAIEESDGVNQVIQERCIGCGLCISTCPSEAIRLVRKQPEELVPPPKDEMAWFDERARRRGVDISEYK
ncbi:MAG: 4Fe-4S binding protein [Deltaproteobacteria bacterium]|nr:4Fe-4S binding protein [Deltaproteobacteria bacterium]